MARNMSFSMTTEQIRNRTKTVTRRKGWRFLKVGDILQAVEKSQGLKKGEKVKRLARIRVKDVRQESLRFITYCDLEREGFLSFTPDWFVSMWVKTYGGAIDQLVTRIEFEYLAERE